MDSRDKTGMEKTMPGSGDKSWMVPIYVRQYDLYNDF